MTSPLFQEPWRLSKKKGKAVEFSGHLGDSCKTLFIKGDWVLGTYGKRAFIALVLTGISLGIFGSVKRGLLVSAEAIGDKAARRIISMAPNITETIFALGFGDRVVGVTDFCVYPPQAKELPKVGGFFNPNLERLAALQPDLVILQGRHDKVDRFCAGRHIAAFHVNMDSLSTIYSGIRDLGEVLGAHVQAQVLCTAIRNELEAVRADVSGRDKKKVFVSLGRAMGSMANLYTVGGTSFLSEVLEIAGGENIFRDVTQPYPEASKESLIKRAPDVILEMRPGETLSPEDRRRIIAEWQIFRNIPAVSHGDIQVVTEDFVLVPGPRVAAIAKILAEALHEKKP
jgi:iron complex transport system substrate-binding protein